MSLKGATDNDKFRDLCSKHYKDQAVWFLNSFWKSYGQKEAENIWSYTQKMVDLDKDKGKEGNQLDEFQAHRFLESIKETHTVLELREKLTSAGVDKNKYFPLSSYLVSKYAADWKYLVNAPQGDNQEEVIRAQKMLEGVQKAFEEITKTAEEAAVKEKQAQVAAQAAKAAQAEQEKTLAEVKAQEDAFNNKTQELTRKTEEGSAVQQNKAKAELAQHLASDPLPLRKAKITNEAAVKKAEKASKAAEAAVEAATQAKAAAERAVEDAKAKLAEAEAYLEEVKNKPGSAQGALWFMERELHEARAYLPTAKGGYAKKNVRADEQA
jgi:DNA repair exonuclease SbcCD ATPase subunit